MAKKFSLRDEIHQIQDGIENVHGDVAYGERQYLFLFKKWALKCIGVNHERRTHQWAYRLHDFDTKNQKNQPDLKIWVESGEYIRGYNERSKLFRQNIEKITIEDKEEDDDNT